MDPKNPDVVYCANTSTYRSTDGGQTFTAIKGAPGGDDYHRIWINPENPQVMIFGVDQGATITVNGGETWSCWYNQPTAQFFHVSTDNRFPYRVYGGQQESGSAGVSSRGNDGAITFREFHPVGVEEYGYVAPDPLHPGVIYGGKLTRYDEATGQIQNVGPVPLRGAKDRFDRTAPVLFSPADPHVLFFASQVLCKDIQRRRDLGDDQPGPDSRRPGKAAEPRTPRGQGHREAPGRHLLDRAFSEGRRHDLGRDRRRPDPRHPRRGQDLARRHAAGADAVEQGDADGRLSFRHGDRLRFRLALPARRPEAVHLPDARRRKDLDRRSWPDCRRTPRSTRCAKTRRERASSSRGRSARSGSRFDDGDHWQSLRLNMPATSIRDLVIHEDDVVVGTHGRSFWILDDITPLRQLDARVAEEPAHLFRPQLARRVRWNMNDDTPLPPEEPAGKNPPDGAILDYSSRPRRPGR